MKQIIEGAHITSVEVLQGDDNYNYTKSLFITSKGNDLEIIEKNLDTKSEYRLRNEPQVKINFTLEDNGEIKTLKISHHKGSIYVELNE